jgi:5-methyltetrahydrofolate--homocysteine methyltransferase
MRIKFDEQKVLVCDGAMGTMIFESGVNIMGCPELLNETHPQVIIDIHKAYVKNGANLVETNTFGGSTLKLREYGLADRSYDLCKIGAEMARDAVGDEALVAGSVGSTGTLLEPMGKITFEEVYESFKIQMQGLADGGVDLYLLETMMEITELKAAYLAARDVAPHIPIICQMTYTESGTTVMGTTPEIAATVMEYMGADYIGVNCSTGPEGLLNVVRRMGAVSNVPLTVQPNAGLPEMEDGHVVYRETPETMASFVKEFVAAGAKIVGGCCGSTPVHIKAIADAAAECSYLVPMDEKPVALCSRRARMVLGEKQLKAAVLMDNEESKAVCLTGDGRGLNGILRKQVKKGANCLYLGLTEDLLSDELVKQMILGLNGPLSLPLVISAASGKYLEGMLRLASGNVLIADVAPEQFETVLPLAKRYGAGLVLRPKNEKELIFCETLIGKAIEQNISKGLVLLDASLLVAETKDSSWLERVLTISQHAMISLDSLGEDLSSAGKATLVLADFRDEQYQGL